MAAFGVSTGSGANGSTASLQWLYLAALPAGAIAFCYVYSTVQPTSVSDDAGNTYALVGSGTANGGSNCYIYSVVGAAAAATTNTLTVGFAAAQTVIAASDYFTSAFGQADAAAASAPGATTTPSVGPTAAVAWANEFAIAIVGASAGVVRSFTAGGAYTRSVNNGLGGGTILMLGVEYVILVGTSGGQTATGTWNGAITRSSALVQTFKDSSTPAGGGAALRLPTVPTITTLPSVA